MRAEAITPIINVSDLEASFKWFEDWGWHRLWDWGDPPDFGAVGSGECEIFLAKAGRVDGERAISRSLSAPTDGTISNRGYG